MKAIDIPVGARVRAKFHYYGPGGTNLPANKRPTGMVVANDLRFQGDEVVVVEWDNSKDILPANTDDLELITESQLESDFMSLTNQIKNKMKSAAHALKEAQKMALLNGYDLHGYDLHGAMTPFMEAMDDIGWRTSSLVC